MVVARRPDSDFYRTFFNSVCRDLFGTVGVNPEVEFTATSVGRASGAVPIRVYRVGTSLPTGGARNHRTDLPFGAAIRDQDAGGSPHQRRDRPPLLDRTAQRAPESIELIEPVFYRGMKAFTVGRLIGDGSITPLVVCLQQFPGGRQGRCRDDVAWPTWDRCSAMRVPISMSICRWSSAAITLLRSFMPRKSGRRTVYRARPRQAGQDASATSRCSAISNPRSTASCMRRANAAW